MNKVLKLKKNYEFSNVLKKGRFFIEKQIIVYITKNKYNKNFIGIAINSKLCKATKRNRLKRLISENYRLIQNELRQGYNIVFIWNKKTEINEANFYKIKNDMNKVFIEYKML